MIKEKKKIIMIFFILLFVIIMLVFGFTHKSKLICSDHYLSDEDINNQGVYNSYTESSLISSYNFLTGRLYSLNLVQKVNLFDNVSETDKAEIINSYLEYLTEYSDIKGVIISYKTTNNELIIYMNIDYNELTEENDNLIYSLSEIKEMYNMDSGVCK